jgi:hypothetical protein
MAALAIGVVTAYYLLVWLHVGRDPKPGTIVIQYEPPSKLSPAMARYIWKQGFDDRAFWACILSLVSKGCVSLVSSPTSTYIQRLQKSPEQPLSREEQSLLASIRAHRSRKGISSNMLEPETIYAAERVAAALRFKNLGQWFRENRNYVISGSGLSLLATYVVATCRPWTTSAHLLYALP